MRYTRIRNSEQDKVIEAIFNNHAVNIRDVQKDEKLLTLLLNKLAAYEEFEGNNQLILLPCPLGSQVYALRSFYECEYDYDPKYCQENWCIHPDNWNRCEHEYKKYVIQEVEFELKHIPELYKTIFSTKEACEKAKAKLEEINQKKLQRSRNDKS